MGEGTSFFTVIYNHLFGVIKLGVFRKDIEVHSDALLSFLKPYVDDKVEDFKEDNEDDDPYQRKIDKIKTIMILLHRIEIIPNSTSPKKERVHSEYDPQGDVVSISRDGLDNELVFKDLMMKYYYYLSRLTFNADDQEAIEYVLDIGYGLLTPYITYDDKDDWNDAKDMKEEDGYKSIMKKIEIISDILNREKLQFTERFVDEMTTDFSEEALEDESELYS